MQTWLYSIKKKKRSKVEQKKSETFAVRQVIRVWRRSTRLFCSVVVNSPGIVVAPMNQKYFLIRSRTMWMSYLINLMAKPFHSDCVYFLLINEGIVHFSHRNRVTERAREKECHSLNFKLIKQRSGTVKFSMAGIRWPIFFFLFILLLSFEIKD